MTAFLDADLPGLGAFDLTTRGKALIAKNAQSFNFRALTTAFAVLEYLDVPRTGHSILVRCLGIFWKRTPEHKQFADVLDRRGTEFVGQGLKHRFADRAIIGKDAHLDQTMRFQGCVRFLLDRGAQTFSAHHDDRIKVMGLRTVLFALARSQLNLRHGAIIGHEGEYEGQKQKQ